MTVEFTFPAGDQVDLECCLKDEMIKRASNIQYAVDNPYGEFLVRQGEELHRVQWQYVGLEPEDYEEQVMPQGEIEYVPVGNWFWEYGSPDFEVSCSRREE